MLRAFCYASRLMLTPGPLNKNSLPLFLGVAEDCIINACTYKKRKEERFMDDEDIHIYVRSLAVRIKAFWARPPQR